MVFLSDQYHDDGPSECYTFRPYYHAGLLDSCRTLKRHWKHLPRRGHQRRSVFTSEGRCPLRRCSLSEERLCAGSGGAPSLLPGQRKVRRGIDRMGVLTRERGKQSIGSRRGLSLVLYSAHAKPVPTSGCFQTLSREQSAKQYRVPQRSPAVVPRL